MMLKLSLFTLGLLGYVIAQQTISQEVMKLDSIHNKTSLIGTWSSGSRKVVTGSGFADPVNTTFTYPPTAGVSFSFTDSHYEIARYRWAGNGAVPGCITATMIWVHGTYEILPNASIIMTPFGDGYQQVEDPCAPVTNFLQLYNYTELFRSWRIFQDPVDGYKLHLFQFDDSPVAPLFQVSVTPIMLPTKQLRNDSISTNAGIVQ